MPENIQKPGPGSRSRKLAEENFHIPGQVHERFPLYNGVQIPNTDISLLVTPKEANFLMIILEGNYTSVNEAGKLAGYSSPSGTFNAYNKFRDALHLPPPEEILDATRQAQWSKVAELHGHGLTGREIAEEVGGSAEGIVRGARRRHGLTRRLTDHEEVLSFAEQVYRLQTQEPSLTQQQIAERLHSGDISELNHTFIMVRNVIQRKDAFIAEVPELSLASDLDYLALEENLYNRFTGYGITMLTTGGIMADFDKFLKKTPLENSQFAALIGEIAIHGEDPLFIISFGMTRVFMIKDLHRFYGDKGVNEIMREDLESALAAYIQKTYENPPLEPLVIARHFLRKFQIPADENAPAVDKEAELLAEETDSSETA